MYFTDNELYLSGLLMNNLACVSLSFFSLPFSTRKGWNFGTITALAIVYSILFVLNNHFG